MLPKNFLLIKTLHKFLKMLTQSFLLASRIRSVVGASGGQILIMAYRRYSCTSSVWMRDDRSSSSSSSSSGPLFPYSNSLPSPGYEWCRKCHVPSRHLQKVIGKPDPCHQLPSLPVLGDFYWSYCEPARHYYRQQFMTMMLLALVCFVSVPSSSPSPPTTQEDSPESS